MGLLPGLFASFIFFILANNEIHKAVRYKYLLGFLYSFNFYLFIKLFTLRGVFYGFMNLYDSAPKGFISYLIILMMESIVPGLTGLLLQWLYRFKARAFFPLILIALLGLTNHLSYIWLPQGVEIPLAQNSLLLSVVGLIHIKGLMLWFFSACVLLYTARAKKIMLPVLLWIIFPFALGSWRKNQIMQGEFTKVPVVLVQTNQSELAGQQNPIEWDKLREALKQRTNLESNVFLPEYTANLNNPYWSKFLKQIREDHQNLHLYLGIEDSSLAGIKNEIWQLDNQKILARFSKKISFPIGETEIYIPFLPKSWLRPMVTVQSGHHSELLKLGNIQIIPLICYEAAMSFHYDQVLKLADKKLPSIFVNFSKDSHLQGSSALDWLDIFARLKTSELGKTMLRVSTNSYTEVITPWGEVLIQSEKNKFQLLETYFPLYKDTYSLWAD